MVPRLVHYSSRPQTSTASAQKQENTHEANHVLLQVIELQCKQGWGRRSGCRSLHADVRVFPPRVTVRDADCETRVLLNLRGWLGLFHPLFYHDFSAFLSLCQLLLSLFLFPQRLPNHSSVYLACIQILNLAFLAPHIQTLILAFLAPPTPPAF